MNYNIFESLIALRSLMSVIEYIENIRKSQEEIDTLYDTFCNMLYDGMSELYDCTNVHPKSRKKLRHKSKPWWNSTLTILWKVLCKAEHEFLKCTHGIERKRKRNKETQHCFDKLNKKCKRDYQRSLQNDIETLNTCEPKEFWRNLKRLGPKPRSDIPMEVYNRARKSRTTLQNKVRLKVLPEQLTLFVNTSVTFKNASFNSFL